MKFFKTTTFLLMIIFVKGCAPTKNIHEQQLQLSDTTLISIRDGYSERVSEMFAAERGKTLNETFAVNWNESLKHSYPRTAYAAVQFWFNENIEKANAALIEYGQYFIDTPDKNRMNVGWHTEMALRLIEMFGSKGIKSPGLLNSEAEKKIMEGIWTNVKCAMDENSLTPNTMTENYTKESKTWYINSSENLHAQSFTTRWNFALLAKDMPDFKFRKYDDGNTAQWHYEKWTEYLKVYFTERAKKGLFIEMMSRDYNEKTLKGMFNIYDFSPDKELKKKAGLYLDLYFTYLGQEQINGISGGVKSRLYTDINPSTSWLGYIFFGIGQKPHFETTIIDALTTNYRPPLVVIDIACDITGRGNYEVQQRAMGLAVPGFNTPPVYHLRTDSGGIVRYSYCTPDFIIGSALFQSRPYEDWAMISSQNQSRGVIFASNTKAGILPQVEKVSNSREYNSIWSVQKRGTLITQKLKDNRGAGQMKIWFAGQGLSTPAEENQWIFAESEGAFAAVRVVSGGYSWKNEMEKQKGRWLICDNEFTPVILEVDQKKNYQSFANFKEKIFANQFEYSNNVLDYTGLYNDRFIFFANYTSSPRINNVTVNYAPAMTYNSPFLKSDWNSGIVRIQKGKRSIVLDFN